MILIAAYLKAQTSEKGDDGERCPAKQLAHEAESSTADLLRRVGGLGEVARDLAYRLYTTAERKGWAKEALAYNSLVVAWPEIRKLAGHVETAGPRQTSFIGESGS